MISKERFRKNLERVWKKTGLTKRELAKKIDINDSNLSKSISGKQTMNVIAFLKLLDYLGINSDEFLNKKKKDKDE